MASDEKHREMLKVVQDLHARLNLRPDALALAVVIVCPNGAGHQITFEVQGRAGAEFSLIGAVEIVKVQLVQAVLKMGGPAPAPEGIPPTGGFGIKN